jgi:DNA-binding HxlR family transcriptional regulator
MQASEALGRGGEPTTTDVLRLLSAGASGGILMALGKGPLRTKELTERISGYASRTIYRYATRLTQIGVVERDEEPGVPSKVVHSLTEPRGREFYELIDAFARVSLEQLPNGEIQESEWGALALIADLWESGMIDQLNLGPKSLTELTEGGHGLSFHQVSRRANLLVRGGFIEEAAASGRHRRYALTAKARRVMGLVAGIGRWRRRHVVPGGATGLSVADAAGLMRTVLPLVVLPDHAGKNFELKIVSVGETEAAEEPVWGGIGEDGSVVNYPAPLEPVHSAAHGNVMAWVDSVLDGPRNGLKVKGDPQLIADCLRHLHATLWSNGNGSATAAAEAVAGGRNGS